MGVNVTANLICTVQETLETNPYSAAAAGRIVTHSLFNSSKILTAATTPPVTKVAAFKQALSAGAATIDLTALTGTNGAIVDGTGLKVQVLKVKNTGVAPLTITPGAVSGYNLLGAGMSLILAQNQELEIFGNDATPDIAAGAKNLDLAGTLAQESEWIIVMG